MSPEISILLLASPLLLLIAWLSARPKRPSAPDRPRLDLAELQALGQRRIDAMQDCIFSLVCWQSTRAPHAPSSVCLTRQMPGRWLSFQVQVTPSAATTPWWPCAISVESPQFLAQRDALPQADGPDYERALHLRIQTVVEGHSVEACLHGPHRVTVLAYVPDCCTDLEIGYYGRPLLTLHLGGRSCRGTNCHRAQ
ncbi:hypothetical protein IV102_14255 [bacterium]|nr:hypothetical protein [bacterium]